MDFDDLNLEKMPLYSRMDGEDRRRVLKLYKTKVEARENGIAELEKSRGVETVACVYESQHDAFWEVIKKYGFEPERNIPRDVDAKIALITNFNTLFFLGKPIGETGREIRIDRIYYPGMQYNGRVDIIDDLELGVPPRFIGVGSGTSHTHTALKGLASKFEGDDMETIKLAKIVFDEIKSKSSLLQTEYAAGRIRNK